MASQAPPDTGTRRFVAALAVFVVVVAADAALAVFAAAAAIGAAVTRSPDLVKSSIAFGFSILALSYLAQNLVDQLMDEPLRREPEPQPSAEEPQEEIEPLLWSNPTSFTQTVTQEAT